MNKIKNIIVVIALCASLAMADGHTGSGDRCTTCTPPPCTENCGGLAADEQDTVPMEEGTEPNKEETSLIDYWSGVFLDWVG